MKHVKERHRLRRRVAPVLAAAVAAAGLVAVNASTSSAATPTSGERIVSWKVVSDDGSTGRVERAADVVAPAGQRFVTAIPNANATDGVLALTNQGKVIVGGTVQLPVPQAVLDGTIVDLGTNDGGQAYTAVSDSGVVYGWKFAGAVSSPAGTCAAKSATNNEVVVAVVCKDGSVEFFPMAGESVPSYFSSSPPSVLDGVTDVTLTSNNTATTGNTVAVAVNGNGDLIRWGQGITGYDAPPRTAGKKFVSVEPRNAITTTGAIVSYASEPRHDLPFDDGGVDPDLAAEGFVAAVSSPRIGFGITTAGHYATWSKYNAPNILGALRTLPSGLSDARFVTISANFQRVAAIVADTDAPTGPQVSSPSTVSGATGGLATPGSTLSGTPATFTGSVTTTTDWLVDGQAIASASGSLTLPVTAEMVDKDITFRTQATGGGLTEPLNSVSAPVKVVGSLPHVVVTPSTISGNPASGLTLTGTPATFDTTPDTVSTRWLVDGAEELDFRDSPTLMLTDAMVGKKVTFSTRGIWDADDGAPATVSTSSPTDTIRPALVANKVTVEGEPVVGSMLRVKVEWSEDGPDRTDDGGTWYQDFTTPVGTGSTYKVTKADIGTSIGWLAIGSRYPDEAAYAISDPIGPVTAAQLAITGAPTISGSPVVGGTLTAAPAPVSDDEADVELSWFVGGDATGTTGTTYSPKAEDLGKTVTVKQVASIDGATSGTDYASAESAATATVTEKPADLSIESAATLSGTPLEGKTLTGTPAEFSPTEDVMVTNYWVVGGTQTEASGTTLTLGADEVGKSIQFRSIATRGDDTLSSTSEAVGPVIARLASTAKPRVEGTPKVGQTLSGVPGSFSASEGVTVKNYWVVNGEQELAEGGLALTDEFEGKTIAFRSVATRGDETVTSTSDPVGPVTKPAPPEPVADVKVLLDGATTPGATFKVRVGKDFDGDTVSASTASPTRELGEHTVDSDGNIEVTLPGDILLGNQTLTVRKGSKVLGNDGYSVSLTRPDGEDGKDAVQVNPDPVQAGADAVVTVGEEQSGEKVRVVAFSSPTALGFKTVGEDGKFRITVPKSLQPGVHRLALYDDGGDLIGYTDFTVTAAAGSGTGGGSGGGTGTGTGSGANLPDTGASLPQYAPALGLLMVLVGLGLVTVRRGGRSGEGRRRAV